MEITKVIFMLFSLVSFISSLLGPDILLSTLFLKTRTFVFLPKCQNPSWNCDFTTKTKKIIKIRKSTGFSFTPCHVSTLYGFRRPDIYIIQHMYRYRNYLYRFIRSYLVILHQAYLILVEENALEVKVDYRCSVWILRPYTSYKQPPNMNLSADIETWHSSASSVWRTNITNPPW
jgi:hypothetical protein